MVELADPSAELYVRRSPGAALERVLTESAVQAMLGALEQKVRAKEKKQIENSEGASEK